MHTSDLVILRLLIYGANSGLPHGLHAQLHATLQAKHMSAGRLQSRGYWFSLSSLLVRGLFCGPLPSVGSTGKDFALLNLGTLPA